MQKQKQISSKFLSQIPTRTENVKFNFELDGSEHELIKAFVDKDLSYIRKHDTVNITYKFFIEYFGNCEKCLKLIAEMVESNRIISYDVEELRYGKSILISLIQSLERINAKTNKTE